MLCDDNITVFIVATTATIVTTIATTTTTTTTTTNIRIACTSYIVAARDRVETRQYCISRYALTNAI